MPKSAVRSRPFAVRKNSQESFIVGRSSFIERHAVARLWAPLRPCNYLISPVCDFVGGLRLAIPPGMMISSRNLWRTAHGRNTILSLSRWHAASESEQARRDRTLPPLRGPPPSTLSVWAAALSLPAVVPLQAQKALHRGGSLPFSAFLYFFLNTLLCVSARRRWCAR